MLTTLDRYLLKEIALTFCATLIVLLSIVLFHRLAQYLSQAASGLLAQGSILLLLGLQAIRHLVELIPVAALLAIMLALGRLYRDSEIVAIHACGLGPSTIYRPLLLLVVPLTLLLTLLAFSVVPVSMQLQYQIRNRAQQEAELSIFQAGAFREIIDGKHVIYVGSLSDDNKRLEDIFVFSDDPKRPAITTGRYGDQQIDPDSGERSLLLGSGFRYQGLLGMGEFYITQFDRLQLRIGTTAQDPASVRRKALPSSELLNRSEPGIQAELQRRLSAPVSLLLLALLAPLLAYSKPREGRYGRVVVAILVYTIYANVLNVGQAWLEKGLLPPVLGLWWVHGLLLLVIGLLWWFLYGGPAWSGPARIQPARSKL